MSNENISPMVLKRVMKELAELNKTPLDGIKIIFEEDNISEIHAIIQGPEKTPYEGGNFTMKLVLSSDFPHSAPKGYFITKIFHPNVSKTGEICVNTIKRDWSPNLGIKHIFLVIKCLLINPNPESALNEEAGKLILENYEEFSKYAKLMTQIHAIKKTDSNIQTNSKTNSKSKSKSKSNQIKKNKSKNK
ncbi:hypothetical protein M0811_06767 [Anaeramoeba ignava]|uniref:E2 ubiquitin-conjugating enzyme n=1 Tax=Anaeramoeba ignava TaxID=1746090 RepID=A0A9Q0LRG0_ANAIG|nr:hypothetical protein M0811_06767 [Anaeramoeba ignava]